LNLVVPRLCRPMDERAFLLPWKEGDMELFLKLAGIVLAVAGAVVVFAAKAIAKSRGMAQKQVINLDIEGEAMESLKLQKAIVKVKLIGGAIFLPGMLVILYAFR
jgi:hypothetical protein